MRLDPHTLPPGPAGAAAHRRRARCRRPRLGGDTIAAGIGRAGRRRLRRADLRPPGRRRRPARRDVWTDRYDDDGTLGVLGDDDGYPDDPATGETDIDEDGARRHRFVVIGLPLLALARRGRPGLVARASRVLSVAGNVDDVEGSTPSASAPGRRLGQRGAPRPRPARPIAIAGADVFDPGGDGEPENPDDVPLAFDGDPATAWSTLEYRGSPAFGNLKDGVGLLLDLGGAQEVAGVDADQHHARRDRGDPGRATRPAPTLDGFTPAADGTIEDDDRVRLRGAGHRPRTCWSGSPAWCRARAASPPTSPRSTVQAAG